jgi:hypothetical protein
LCAAAKKTSKQIKKEKNLPGVPSSLLFYKIQSSFFTSYQDIVERVLKAGDPGMKFDFGPYYINGDYGPPAEGLLECCSFFKKKANAALESRYEEWLRRVYESEHRASLYLERTAALLEQEAIEKYHELTQQLHTLHPALSAEKPYINGKTEGKVISPGALDVAEIPYDNGKTPLYDIITLNSLGGN